MTRITLIAITIALFSTAAIGGAQYEYPVGVTSNAAYGIKHIARYSADFKQHIGCQTGSDASSRWANCSAQDSAGNYRSCYTSDASLVAAVDAISDSAYLYFTWAESGRCTYISVNESSGYLR